MNRLTKLVHSESTTAPTSGWGSDPLAGYQFSYDSASRFTSINSYLDGVTNYTHDDTNQLTGADHATATDESYEYDANGNRMMAGYDVDPNNQLYSDGTYNYTYDDEGNRLTGTKVSDGYVTRYEWDFRNRLVKVTEEDDSNTVLQFTENTYDPFNQLIRRSFDSDGPGGTAAEDTYFVYENGQIVLQFDGDEDSDLAHRYLWGEQVDQLFADETVSSLGSAGTVIWPLGDQVGTLRDLVTYNSGTDDATVANHREIDSYGNVTDESNDTVDLLFGFTARPFDETTGLQNKLHRWYDPSVGRWVSEDPIGFSGIDANVGRYVGNSPSQFVDPFGHKKGNTFWSTFSGDFQFFADPYPLLPLRQLLPTPAPAPAAAPNSSITITVGNSTLVLTPATPVSVNYDHELNLTSLDGKPAYGDTLNFYKLVGAGPVKKANGCYKAQVNITYDIKVFLDPKKIADDGKVKELIYGHEQLHVENQINYITGWFKAYANDLESVNAKTKDEAAAEFSVINDRYVKLFNAWLKDESNHRHGHPIDQGDYPPQGTMPSSPANGPNRPGIER